MNKEKQKIISDICPFYKEYGTCEQCNKALDIDGEPCYWECMANAIIANDYRKQSEPISCNHEEGGEWISVEDRLPEENGRYLVCIKVSHQLFENLTTIAVLDYNKSHGFYLYSIAESVTHWMPLPEAPKMKGGAE